MSRFFKIDELIWESSILIDNASALDQSVDFLSEEYKNAIVECIEDDTFRSFTGYSIRITFRNVEDEAEFILQESV